MELCDVSTNSDECMIGATRALFTLKRAAGRIDASVAWARVSASVLSASKNRAIAAEARRLHKRLYDLGRPYRPSAVSQPSQPNGVVWVSFSRSYFPAWL